MGPIMMAVEPRLKVGVVVVAGFNFQQALLMLNEEYDFFAAREA